MEQSASPSLGEPSLPCSVVGIDIGSESCRFCILKSDKRVVIKPTTFANTASGFALLTEKREALGVSAHYILIGLEATSRDARKPLPLFAKSRLPDVEAHILDKLINLHSSVDYGRKQIHWMPAPSLEYY